MPTNLVKTGRDERLWEKAKQLVRAQYHLTEADGHHYWRLVNAIYRRAKGEVKKGFLLSFRKSKNHWEDQPRSTEKGKEGRFARRYARLLGNVDPRKKSELVKTPLTAGRMCGILGTEDVLDDDPLMTTLQQDRSERGAASIGNGLLLFDCAGDEGVRRGAQATLHRLPAGHTVGLVLQSTRRAFPRAGIVAVYDAQRDVAVIPGGRPAHVARTRSSVSHEVGHRVNLLLRALDPATWCMCHDLIHEFLLDPASFMHWHWQDRSLQAVYNDAVHQANGAFEAGLVDEQGAIDLAHHELFAGLYDLHDEAMARSREPHPLVAQTTGVTWNERFTKSNSGGRSRLQLHGGPEAQQLRNAKVQPGEPPAHAGGIPQGEGVPEEDRCSVPRPRLGLAFPLAKSTVKAHTRRLPSGKTVQVREHRRKGDKHENPQTGYDPVADYQANGTRSQAFKAWFGDWEHDPEHASKVVDSETGEPEAMVPLVLYHGTPRGEFDSFDPHLIGTTSDAGFYGTGFYFTSSREEADLYSQKLGGTHMRVYECYISIKRPFVIDFRTYEDAVVTRERVRSIGARLTGGGFINSPEEFTASLLAAGYDGVMAWRDDRENVEVVAFRPEQIKAIDNAGTFDPNEASMYKGMSPGPLLAFRKTPRPATRRGFSVLAKAVVQKKASTRRTKSGETVQVRAHVEHRKDAKPKQAIGRDGKPIFYGPMSDKPVTEDIPGLRRMSDKQILRLWGEHQEEGWNKKSLTPDQWRRHRQRQNLLYDEMAYRAIGPFWGIDEDNPDPARPSRKRDREVDPERVGKSLGTWCRTDGGARVLLRDLEPIRKGRVKAHTRTVAGKTVQVASSWRKDTRARPKRRNPHTATQRNAMMADAMEKRHPETERFTLKSPKSGDLLVRRFGNGPKQDFAIYAEAGNHVASLRVEIENDGAHVTDSLTSVWFENMDVHQRLLGWLVSRYGAVFSPLKITRDLEEQFLSMGDEYEVTPERTPGGDARYRLERKQAKLFDVEQEPLAADEQPQMSLFRSFRMVFRKSGTQKVPVKASTRRTKSGKTTTVKQHTATRKKAEPKPAPASSKPRKRKARTPEEVAARRAEFLGQTRKQFAQWLTENILSNPKDEDVKRLAEEARANALNSRRPVSPGNWLSYDEMIVKEREREQQRIADRKRIEDAKEGRFEFEHGTVYYGPDPKDVIAEARPAIAMAQFKGMARPVYIVGQEVGLKTAGRVVRDAAANGRAIPSTAYHHDVEMRIIRDKASAVKLFQAMALAQQRRDAVPDDLERDSGLTQEMLRIYHVGKSTASGAKQKVNVKGSTRRTESGQVVTVRPHRATRKKADAEPARTQAPASEQIVEISIAKVQPDPNQHRKHFAQREMQELADSIRQTGGNVTPIVVKPVDGAGKVQYQIIAGERRYRAIKMNGMKTIRAVVREGVSDEDALAEQVIENLNRQNVSPTEEATAYRQLADGEIARAKRRKEWRGSNFRDFEVQDKLEALGRAYVARKTGKKRDRVNYYIVLNDLPGEVKEMVDRGHLTTAHAHALLRLTSRKEDSSVADPKIMRERQQHLMRMARHARANGLPAGKLNGMVTEYIRANQQLRAFSDEETTGGEKQVRRQEQKAKLNSILDAVRDVLEKTYNERKAEFTVDAFTPTDLEVALAQIDGALATFDDLRDSVERQLLAHEAVEATKRRVRRPLFDDEDDEPDVPPQTTSLF